MIARYVLKSLGRHKVRTAIMLLALLLVTAMLITLNNIVESLQQQNDRLVGSSVGEHDITIDRAETSLSQTIDVDRVSAIVRGVDPAVVAVYPRFQATVELQGYAVSGTEEGGQAGSASLVARVPEDDLGQVTMVEGEYDLEGDQVVVMAETADTFGLEVGDEVSLRYVLPVSRLPGHDLPEHGSVSRVERCFTVSGIALASGLGGAGRNGVLVSVETVQDWLGLPGQAERLVVALDETVYNSMDTQASVFRVRRIAEKMHDALIAALGSEDEAQTYTVVIDKARLLEQSTTDFAFQRALSGVYGFLVMGVVGLLIYSLINTNVEEWQRDLAFLRVLGARRRDLFNFVLVEAVFVGLIGVGLGIALGQAFSFLALPPLINHFVAGEGGGVEFQMTATLAALSRTVLTTIAVVAVSAIAPAFRAATTKVRYVTNPGCADSLQVEDLARLRSRKFDVRLLLVGVVLTAMWAPILVSLQALIAGDVSVVAVLMFGGLAVMVTSVSLLFYALTVPFERGLQLMCSRIFPRLAFFAGPNLMRAKRRNTMISLMIVLSATLPTFLGTMAILEQKNSDYQMRLENGAPVVVQVLYWGWYAFENQGEEYLRPGSLDEFRSVPGVAQAVGLTAEYATQVSNKVELRNTGVRIQGITGSLADIVYSDLTKYTTDGPRVFDRILAESDTIILSTAYADYMDLSVGDVVRVQGAGKDHVADMRVAGLIECLPGFPGIYVKDAVWRDWSVGLVSLDTYLRLTHDPNVENVCPQGVCLPMERDQPVIAQVLAAVAGDADEEDVVADLRKLFSDREDVWVESTAESVQQMQQYMNIVRMSMLGMAVLSFVTSILGVFTVVYVAVHVRRKEIGMLKAVGMSRRTLVGAFALESVMLTVSAALVGTVAGTTLGYVLYFTLNLMRLLPMPKHLTFDWLTMTGIVVMVILASVVSASVAARGVVRSKVTMILREV
jgi:putative ABC transport system permease protein